MKHQMDILQSIDYYSIDYFTMTDWCWFSCYLFLDNNCRFYNMLIITQVELFIDNILAKRQVLTSVMFLLKIILQFKMLH